MKLFNILILLNFVERITIPPVVCTLLPFWKTSSPSPKKQIKENLHLAASVAPNARNRRHCGQSQQSAVIKQKARQTNSKIRGEERKNLAKSKKSRK